MIATSSSISEILFYLLTVDKEHIEVTVKLLSRRNNSLGIVLYKNSSAIKFVFFFKDNYDNIWVSKTYIYKVCNILS